jgi:membrane associated rhomboid family serine protease
MSNQPAIQRPFQYRQYNAAFILIGINIAIFLLTNVTPRALNYLAMNPVLVVRGNYWWQVFTYMFVHAGFSHILFNMLALFFFGTQLERTMGSTEFLVYYLSSGVVAGLFSLLVYWLSGSYQVFLLGASGAVFAVLLAFASFYPDARIFIFGILPVKAYILVIAYTAIELFSQITARGSNVAHLTHLAGFGAGFVYLVVRLRINPIQVFMSRRR